MKCKAPISKEIAGLPHMTNAHDDICRRSSRLSRPKDSYSHVLTPHGRRKHTLNRGKSMKKIADATERELISTEMKADNLIATCSPMAYQYLKAQINSYMVNRPDYSVTAKRYEADDTGAIEHEIVKVYNNTKRSAATINFYNTITRIMINGHGHIDITIDIMTTMMENIKNNTKIPELDQKLRECIEQWLPPARKRDGSLRTDTCRTKERVSK